MMRRLYAGLTVVAGPLIDRYLERRRRLGKEDPARYHERLGHASRPRPDGLLVWIHGASVGEAVSILPLIEKLLATRETLSILVTTGTVTSARLLETRLPAGAFHQYVPVDRPADVRRFLDHWRPDLALWLESEFWPNIIAETQARAIPMALLQGRVSALSFDRWRRFPWLIRSLLSGFALCLGQTEGDTERLRRLGAGRARCLGNLKFAAPPLPADFLEVERLREAIGARAVWLAVSTHPGEERLAGLVHRRLAPFFAAGLVTLIVPRHPHRGPEIAAEIRGLGLTTALRSQHEPFGEDTAVYIGDTLGELGLFYRLAPVVFVGGSLIPHGGQNPLEPARLGCAILHGPHIANFAEIIAEMAATGAAIEIDDEVALAEMVQRLLSDPEALAPRVAAARHFAQSRAEVLDAVMAALVPLLPPAVETARARA